jgi:hypothetical protein
MPKRCEGWHIGIRSTVEMNLESKKVNAGRVVGERGDVHEFLEFSSDGIRGMGIPIKELGRKTFGTGGETQHLCEGWRSKEETQRESRSQNHNHARVRARVTARDSAKA